MEPLIDIPFLILGLLGAVVSTRALVDRYTEYSFQKYLKKLVQSGAVPVEDVALYLWEAEGRPDRRIAVHWTPARWRHQLSKQRAFLRMAMTEEEMSKIEEDIKEVWTETGEIPSPKRVHDIIVRITYTQPSS